MRVNKLIIAVLCAGFFSMSASNSQDYRTSSVANSAVYIIQPMNNAIVQNPVTVKFGLRGMGVAPAGVEKPGTGHHHLIIDAPLPPMDENIPADENHIHFGGGQTETTMMLAPGQHTLQLLLGDQNHLPHNPPIVSKMITITVAE